VVVLFISGGAMKLPKSYEEQLKILESRHLFVKDREKALKILSNINYYNLTGYLFWFKDKKGNYQKEASFEQAVILYSFDKEIHSLLLFLLTEIEQTLKTKIANTIALAHPENPCIYEEETFFVNSSEHHKFIKEFRRNVEQNKGIEFVKHHKQHYQNKFPIWVAVELFTMGNIKYFYKNLPSSLRKQISREFNVSPVILDDWIESLRILRNLAAHNIRLYHYTFSDTPKLSAIGYHENIDNRLFGQFLLLKYLFFDKEVWLEKMNQLKELIQKNRGEIDFSKIGFPSDWFDELVRMD
jgi:abortive infection bacteriophage resistance protein